MKLTVNLEKNSYPIYIENHILADAGTYIKEVFHGRKIMIVSDDNVYPMHCRKYWKLTLKSFILCFRMERPRRNLSLFL